MSKVLGVGEILWDIFPTGKFLGGAPVNFVYHCRQMGLDAHPVSRVGNDDLGREILADVKAKGVPADLIQTDPDHPTGTVRVEMAGTEHRFIITENVAWDFIRAEPRVLAAARESAAVCFGSLAQRSEASRAAIMAIVNECPGLRVFDINLRQQFFTREIIEDSLEFSNVLKLNGDEVAVLREMLGLAQTDTAQVCRTIMKEYDLSLVCVTRGAQGALLVSPSDVVDQPGSEVAVVDTVGCGDAFTAALVHGLLTKKDLATIARNACRVGEFVATRPGGTPPWPEEMVRRQMEEKKT